eukprot:TRINITY_DN81147_c0_g1_i1.p1 TRINITY_DN81147_c0_g1~~TRINITY_DN81147_c0_g1_i1.p1  ORF type:complete len:732 (-),score=239.36 TRINITY_DN81147_c0_g1_i1:117-2312(-)
MTARVTVLAILFFAVSAAASSSQFLSFDETEASTKGNAVRKVVQLLQDMDAKIVEEQETDQAIFDKFSCWCDTNIADKTRAISTGNARVKYLTGHAETLSANIGTFIAESLNLKKDIAKGKEAIDQANALRAKQKAEFQAIEKDVLDTVNQLVEAESTIAASIAEEPKAKDAALLQTNLAKTQTLLASLQKQVAKTAGHLALSDHNSNVDDFLKNPLFRSTGGAIFLQRSGAPGADDALGVVSGVKSDYVYNLGALRTQETENFQTYRKLVTAKEAELRANEKQLQAKIEATGKAEQQKADEQREIEETKQTIEADTTFLQSVQEKCRLKSKEWDERQKTRRDEQEAIAKTIEVLDGDEARESFTSALTHSSFIQVSSVSKEETRRRDAASAALAEVGGRLDARLVSLAMRTKLDGFDRVKTAIQEMIDALNLEQKNEVKQRDYCVDSFNQNELNTQENNQNKDSLSAKIAELTATMKAAKDEADVLNAEIADMEKQIKLAEQNREGENKAYQPVIKEQRVVQTILAKAQKVLKGYYNVPEQASLIQIRSHHQQQLQQHLAKKAAHRSREPDNLLSKPEEFKEYKQSSGGYAVIELIERLINDSKKLEAESMEDERQSQKSYEELVTEARATIASKRQAVVELMQQRALDEEDRTEATESHTFTTNELSQLAASKKQLHEQCDWVLKNFEVTQKARLEEMESLRQAQGILSGDTETGKNLDIHGKVIEKKE